MSEKRVSPMTPTPRTDSLEFYAEYIGYVVWAHNAEELERETVALRAHCEAMYAAAKENDNALCASEQDHAAWLRIKQAGASLDSALAAYRLAYPQPAKGEQV